MITVVGVKFGDNGKIEYFTPENLFLNIGNEVICEGPIGMQLGKVVLSAHEIDETTLSENYIINPVLRLATQKDLEKDQQNKEKAKQALIQTHEIIKKYNLDMKLLDAEYSLDMQKLMFTFSSEDRVDFRELLKELAQVFKVRIELRQVGIRDEVKMIGGLGPCGRIACCKLFLSDYGKVGIKMAKQQCLSLNPTKINGICGKIMCCIAYENDNYTKNLEELPKIGDRVKTPEGSGLVVYLNILDKIVTVRLSDDDNRLVEYSSKEIKVYEQ